MNLLGSLHSLISGVGPFFILLGILIFVHELGHFLVAKFFGVRVEVFSMGFGKRIFQYKKGDTNYCISLIPLGGYVKMFGDDPNAEVPVEERKYAFLHKPIPQRFAIVLAGPLMNLFFAVFIFSAIAAIGENVSGPWVGDIAPQTEAYKAGFRSGDKVLSVNGEDTASWNMVQKAVEGSGGKVIQVKVERKGEAQPLAFEASVGFGENENLFAAARQVGQIPGLTSESRSTMIGISDTKSPAGAAGVPGIAYLSAVNGKKVHAWRDLDEVFKDAVKPGAGSVTLELQKDIEKPEGPDNVLSVNVKLPDNYSEQKDPVAALGIEPAELYIYSVKKDSPADHAGILAKDKVLRVGGEPVTAWNDVLNRVKNFDPSTDGMDFTVLRNGEEKTLHVKPEMTTIPPSKTGMEEHRYTIGIVSGFFPSGPEPVFYRLTNPADILHHGIVETGNWTEFVVYSLVRMFQGEVSPKNLGGVITIGRVASQSFAAGMTVFMRMMGLISINLFLLNLLPVPILDGGHLVFYSIEAVKGAPLSMRKMEIAQQVGLMLLMFLMAFAFFNDITNLFTNRW